MSRAAQLRKQAREKLEAAAEFEAREQLTEDETAAYDALLDEAEALSNEADEIEASEKRFADQRARRAALAEKSAKKPTVGAGAHAPLPARPKQKDPSNGFASVREFLFAVKNAGEGRGFDDRLSTLAAAGSDEMGGYSNPYGGFLIPEAYMPQLMMVDPETDLISSLVRRIPMQSPRLRIPARVDKNHSSSVSGGATVKWRAEADTVSSSRPEIEEFLFEAHTLMGLSFATEEILNDSAISIIALLEQSFGQEMAAEMLDARINGSGVGKPLGVLKSDCLIEVAKETGQAADTIVLDNLTKMKSRAWRYNNSVWVANHDVQQQLNSLTRSVGTGGTAVVLTDATQPGIDGVLLGRPIIFTEFAQKLGDKGDIILADWSQYLEGIYQGQQSAESMHVRFVNNERAFRFTMRCAGSPWWRSALTPRYSSSTLSPFVTLAARA